MSELLDALRDCLGRTAHHGRGGRCRIVEAALVVSADDRLSARLIGQSRGGSLHGWALSSPARRSGLAPAEAARQERSLAASLRRFRGRRRRRVAIG